MDRPIIPDSAEASEIPAHQPWRHPAIKFFTCFFAALGILDFYNSLVLYPATFLSNHEAIMPIFTIVNFLLVGAAIGFSIVYPINWHHHERRSPAKSPLRFAWLTGIIRYWLAAVIFNYGWAKVFETQFAHLFWRDDSTWGSLSGLDLTWGYFGYSHVMSNIIAAIQIAGCALLLFRRTTLLGIVLLLPVMVNISLIDIFFYIPAGATANAIMFTFALTFLLLLQWPAIRAFLEQTRPTLPRIRLKGMKNILRLVLIAWAIAFIAWLASKKVHAPITGKWRVDSLVRNGRTAAPNDWLTDSLSWKYIYLDENGLATFSPNLYVVERQRSTICQFKYNDPRHIPFINVRNRKDTLQTTVTIADPTHMKWTLIDDPDTVLLTLTRITPP